MADRDYYELLGVGRDLGMTSEPTKAIKSVVLGRPYAISFGGRTDLQYADDVAKTFVRCLEAPYQGAKSYNLRGAVIDLATFHRTLCEVAPEAAELVIFGDRQLGIAYDLDDSALQRDLGPMPVTPLAEAYSSDDGRTCRDFLASYVNGRTESWLQGAACQTGHGRWEIHTLKPWRRG